MYVNEGHKDSRRGEGSNSAPWIRNTLDHYTMEATTKTFCRSFYLNLRILTVCLYVKEGQNDSRQGEGSILDPWIGNTLS